MFSTRTWTRVTSGESGAEVHRSPDGRQHAKSVPAAREAELAGERDRIAWLATTGVPGPTVVDWHVDEGGACLVTSTVEGVPADSVSAGTLRRAWPAIVELVGALHGLPAGDCPFSRDLAAMWAVARDVVARGAVNAAFLPVEQQSTPPAELLARLSAELETRLAQEPADTVVCHGDLCLPNIILTPDGSAVAGLIDLGRLGRADSHADLALLLTNARETWTSESEATAADEAFTDIDDDRRRFYLHLDPLTWG
ncbi:APH(3'') family aminoglycoside O-phosphotransferase [Actinophytocola oryzae]|uniref:Streptomycin 3'-kinase n=1 Tax=Actinophytocola oryzae TaxID=502181 RepID=A0A4R7VUS2_9PSEU|nr:APH(3'') family aminoglycoside O-phosphotransferase [Actinophytocola oryzae]TDV53733.1 streptomycin 3'-kinase [Actinophytocola oryzae]